ncbi:uncharacterized protein LOC141659972 [Apium graveolens]|uniref:uncharacterized protein LOC141659972 n=1 Tax=Apium graveolens TaxID=4045 RepID=UPI003D7953EF
MTEGANPGDERRRFKRFYVCLGPLKAGFLQGCRPLIGLDGCHLKGPLGGILLTVVGTDPDDGIYPLAWAQVEAENNDSWEWFISLLVADLKMENAANYTFISDKQKGLVAALDKLVPAAEHRFCVSAKAYTWLAAKSRSQWSRSGFRDTCKSDMFVNNNCEVYNKDLNKFRHLAIVSMSMKFAAKARPIWNGAQKYNVTMMEGGHEIVVDLGQKICACRKWQLTGIPCYHACVCIFFQKQSPLDYMHECYKKKTYMEVYNHVLEPVNGEQFWEKQIILQCFHL